MSIHETVLKKQRIPPHERAIVEAFKKALPEIIEGKDPEWKPGTVIDGRKRYSGTCIVSGCDNRVHARQLCSKHYARKRRRAKREMSGTPSSQGAAVWL